MIRFSVDLANLSKWELQHFLSEYNSYIVHFYDNHDNGSVPVSMVEFYNNDFQEILNDMV